MLPFLFVFRSVRPTRWSHSSPGHVSSGGPSHRLGGARPHLQGSVAAAHPLHSCCPGEVCSTFNSSCLIWSVLHDHHLLSAPPPRVAFRYNVVFRYLLSVRQVQSQLQHCWALQMQRKRLKSSQTDAVKWRLRNHMAFLIDNLQYYLQVPEPEPGRDLYCTHIHNQIQDAHQPVEPGEDGLYSVCDPFVFPCVSRWTFWSLSSLSCSNRSTPPETLRASDWPTTTS